MTNLLIAIANIVENPNTDVLSQSKSSNRVNAQGDALEFYIRDIFCDSLKVSKGSRKDKIYSKNFSLIGTQNHPPDLILRNGDAIEIKKIESFNGGLALNSSHPKNKLHRDDPKITQACRDCEDNEWQEKDIIYAIGTIPKNTSKLKLLWLVYGDCYAAERGVYEKIINPISEAIKLTPDIHFSEGKELAKIDAVDPLRITNFRVRGMWHIKHPDKLFRDFAVFDASKDFAVNVVLLKEKYISFPKKDRESLEKIKSKNFSIKDVEIKSPNNPAKLLKAKFISYAK